MNKKNPTYRMPEGFNPYSVLDSVRGLTDAIHYSLLEGPCDAVEIEDADKAALNGLTELLREKVHMAHDYFSELENRGLLDLPMSQAEIDAQDLKYTEPGGVKEEPALYIVRR